MPNRNAILSVINAILTKSPIPPIKKTTRNKKSFTIIGIFLIALGLFLLLYNPIREISAPPPACIYASAAKTDTEAIPWLINQEAQANISEDIDLIKEIFADDAMIVDYYNKNSPVIWRNPDDRYTQLFIDADYIAARNTDIKAILISGDTAYYTSASDGTFKANGQTVWYANPDDANHWTVKKISGCWKIIKFEFNASGIKFP